MLKELLSTWVGLLSLGVIVFILGMAVYFYRMFTQKMNDPAEQG